MAQDDMQRAREVTGKRRAPVWSRSGILAVWIILGGFLGAVIGQLLGQALPGDFGYATAIGLGAGIALGAAVGSRRADANDREIARRSEGRAGSDGA
ncbi:MAG: hypothetical protein ACTH6N_14185 [Brachybacterium tyrofermentans]|uniref:hypothetical protein n=1 Tax=Brachybacterium tyrofermentans TaxID=47848 RepID=UPI0018665A4C|nr:hypothetical protein [Brachybacterium tyrofermentans]